VELSSLLPTGLYHGTLFLHGGSAEDSDDILGSQAFSFEVQQAGSSETPEPATMGLAALLLGVLALRLRFSRRPAANR
jgi:hypothetical protein